MAGALTISTLNDSSGVLATQNGMSGIAKAWVNFNGSTAAIRASFNVSSVTRNSTGAYTITMTTALPDANYAVVFTTANATPASSNNAPCGAGVPNTASAFSVATFQSQAVVNQTDNAYNQCAVFR